MGDAWQMEAGCQIDDGQANGGSGLPVRRQYDIEDWRPWQMEAEGYQMDSSKLWETGESGKWRQKVTRWMAV